MTGDRELAKQVLQQHIKKLVLTPKESLPEGKVLFVTGDVDLFFGESNVMPLESLGGNQATLSTPR